VAVLKKPIFMEIGTLITSQLLFLNGMFLGINWNMEKLLLLSISSSILSQLLNILFLRDYFITKARFIFGFLWVGFAAYIIPWIIAFVGAFTTLN